MDLLDHGSLEHRRGLDRVIFLLLSQEEGKLDLVVILQAVVGRRDQKSTRAFRESYPASNQGSPEMSLLFFDGQCEIVFPVEGNQGM